MVSPSCFFVFLLLKWFHLFLTNIWKGSGCKRRLSLQITVKLTYSDWSFIGYVIHGAKQARRLVFMRLLGIAKRNWSGFTTRVTWPHQPHFKLYNAFLMYIWVSVHSGREAFNVGNTMTARVGRGTASLTGHKSDSPQWLCVQTDLLPAVFDTNSNVISVVLLTVFHLEFAGTKLWLQLT